MKRFLTKNFIFSFSVFFLLVISTACSSDPKVEPKAMQNTGPEATAVVKADTIYLNGKIYTVNEAQPWAEAVAIKDGKFVAVGKNTDVETHKADSTTVIDLKGQFVMPGLVDTHTHPFDSSFQILDQLVLDDPKSAEDIQKQVKAYADAHPEKEWITGLAWPKGMFAGETPHRSLLDEVVPDRPIALMDQGGHANWCNTKALWRSQNHGSEIQGS